MRLEYIHNQNYTVNSINLFVNIFIVQKLFIIII